MNEAQRSRIQHLIRACDEVKSKAQEVFALCDGMKVEMNQILASSISASSNLSLLSPSSDNSKIFELPKYRSMDGVDNKLDSLYLKLPYKFEPIVESCNLTVDSSLSPYFQKSGLCVVPDFIPIKFAEIARTFVSLIPFDINTPRLNDTDNLPKSDVFRQLQNNPHKDQLIAKYESELYDKTNIENDVKQWTWENYSGGIFRCLPLTINAFINSPIYDLINIILWKMHASIVEYYKENYAVGLVVLQRSPFDTTIGRHLDDHGSRRISFIYYLTPDTWTAEDGGELILEDRGEIIAKEHTIIPKFNQLVLWKLGDDCNKMYHRVGRVKANNDKPRLAVVGFFHRRR